MTDCAYWNSSKLCWEVWIEEAQGDRYEKVPKEINIAHRLLKDRGIKFVEARSNAYSSQPLLLIADLNFWLDNHEEILDWFTRSNIKYKMQGMILEFDTREEQMMFMLRWQ